MMLLNEDEIGFLHLMFFSVKWPNSAFEDNANFPSPSQENLLFSFGILNSPCCYKRQSSHLFKKSAYFMWFDTSGVLAGSPEPQSISRKPGAIDRVLPATLSRSKKFC